MPSSSKTKQKREKLSLRRDLKKTFCFFVRTGFRRGDFFFRAGGRRGDFFAWGVGAAKFSRRGSAQRFLAWGVGAAIFRVIFGRSAVWFGARSCPAKPLDGQGPGGREPPWQKFRKVSVYFWPRQSLPSWLRDLCFLAKRHMCLG